MTATRRWKTEALHQRLHSICQLEHAEAHQEAGPLQKLDGWIHQDLFPVNLADVCCELSLRSLGCAAFLVLFCITQLEAFAFNLHPE